MSTINIFDVTGIELEEVQEQGNSIWRSLIISHDGIRTEITLFAKNCPAELHVPNDDVEYELGRLKEEIQTILNKTN